MRLQNRHTKSTGHAKQPPQTIMVGRPWSPFVYCAFHETWQFSMPNEYNQYFPAFRKTRDALNVSPVIIGCHFCYIVYYAL